MSETEGRAGGGRAGGETVDFQHNDAWASVAQRYSSRPLLNWKKHFAIFIIALFICIFFKIQYCAKVFWLTTF